MMIFEFYHLFYMSKLAFLCKEEFSLLLPLHIVLLWTHWFLLVIIHYYHCSLWSSNYPKFGQWESLPASPCVLLMCLHCSMSTSLLFASHDAPGSSFTFPVPCLESDISPRSVVVFMVVSSNQWCIVCPSPGVALVVSVWFQNWGLIWDIFPKCRASQALLPGPTGVFMRHPIPFNYSLCI